MVVLVVLRGDAPLLVVEVVERVVGIDQKEMLGLVDIATHLLVVAYKYYMHLNNVYPPQGQMAVVQGEKQDDWVGYWVDFVQLELLAH